MTWGRCGHRTKVENTLTTLAVLADIHGNLPALEAVLADIEAQGGVDQVVIAGDVVNWGPFSAAVMERVTRDNRAIIRGNNEYYLLDYNTPRQPAHWQEYSLLPWLHNQLEGHWQRVIASWPDEITLRFHNAPPIRMFHGQPNNPWHSIHPLMSDKEIATILRDVDTPTVIAAHSHLPLDRHITGQHLINPGSVGVPLDGTHQASYVLLEGTIDGWQTTFRRVDFDLDAVLREFERTQFVATYGVVARLVVKEFKIARLQVHPFHAWRHAEHPDAPESVELLQQFEQVDIWQYTPPEYHINL